MSLPSNDAPGGIVKCAECGRDHEKFLRRGLCHACYERRRKRLHAAGRWESRYVDSEPVRRHVNALRDTGMGTRTMAELAGVNRTCLRVLLIGHTGRPPGKRILTENAKAILAVKIPDVPHRVAKSRNLIDSIGTVRRMQALVAFGYPRAYLAQRLGLGPNALRWLAKPELIRVRAQTARRAEALFNTLQLTPGPSRQAREEGRRRGWLLPFEWDEDELDQFIIRIDDDDDQAEPEQPLTFTEKVEELRYLGYGDIEIAARLGVLPESFERELHRHGLKGKTA
jgi:hypothetical protein